MNEADSDLDVPAWSSAERSSQRLGHQEGAVTDRDRCPVLKQFGVVSWPTLVLLDENGEILWRREGLLDKQKLRDLDLLIQHQLNESIVKEIAKANEVLTVVPA